MKHYVTLRFYLFQRVLILSFLINGIYSFDDYFYGSEGNTPYGYSNMNNEWSNQYSNFDYNDEYGTGASHILDDIGQSIIDVMKSAMDTTKAATAKDVKDGNILNGINTLPQLLHINSNSTIESTSNSTNSNTSAVSENNNTTKTEINSPMNTTSTPIKENKPNNGNMQSSTKQTNQSDITLPIQANTSPLGIINLHRNTLENTTEAYNKSHDAFAASTSNITVKSTTNYPEVNDTKMEPLIKIPMTLNENSRISDVKYANINARPTETTRSSEPVINQQASEVLNVSPAATADQNLEPTFINSTTYDKPTNTKSTENDLFT